MVWYKKVDSLYSPLSGEAKELASCPDEAFASETLGRGVYIEPKEGKVYAPCGSEAVMLFDTLHAIGLVTDNGAELLIHACSCRSGTGQQCRKLSGARRCVR